VIENLNIFWFGFGDWETEKLVQKESKIHHFPHLPSTTHTLSSLRSATSNKLKEKLINQEN
jgi:hypothetical protein